MRPGSRGLSLVDIAYTASLSALAVALHAARIPYPLMPALKYDLAGLPIALIALRSIRLAFASLVVLFVGVMVLGGDVVGASMKTLAEFVTAVPLALSFRLLSRLKWWKRATASTLIAVATRTGVMCLANYLVLPRWALAVGWAKSWEEAYALMMKAMPYVAAFNISVAAPVAILGLMAFRVVERSGLWPWTRSSRSETSGSGIQGATGR